MIQPLLVLKPSLQALLSYLDHEAARLVESAPAAPARSNQQASSQQRGTPPVQMGSGMVSGAFASFLKTAQSLLLKGEASSAEEEPLRTQPPAQEVDLRSFWAELANIRWCPVQREPPAMGLPWPSQARVEGLAAPRTIRPAEDMWLASACLNVLDGNCRWVFSAQYFL